MAWWQKALMKGKHFFSSEKALAKALTSSLLTTWLTCEGFIYTSYRVTCQFVWHKIWSRMVAKNNINKKNNSKKREAENGNMSINPSLWKALGSKKIKSLSTIFILSVAFIFCSELCLSCVANSPVLQVIHC